MKLDSTQAWALIELGRRLQDGATGIVSGLALTDPRRRLQRANTFGLLGPRGAGKSTLLATLHQCWKAASEVCAPPDEAVPGLRDLLKDVFVLRPLDCSILSANVAPGAAILLHLEQELEACCSPRLDEKLTAELRKLSEQYIKTTSQFIVLSAELSATVGEYSLQVMNATRERLALGHRLTDWLDRALEQIEKRAFVVLLDDFDLVHAREVRSWLFSLLDELQQERLLVVVTADFYRLEHLSFDTKAEIDDMTGRALLDKLIPSQNRIDLERWNLSSRSAFTIVPDGSGLEKKIRAYAFGSGPLMGLLTRLLPGWPRGLLNLLHSLEQDAECLERSEGEAIVGSRKTKRFLGQLASCRGEPLLARQLQEVDVTTWLTSLHFKGQRRNLGAWQEAVNEAQGRGRRATGSSSEGKVGLAPIPILLPDLPKDRDRSANSAYTLQFDLSGRDLLRHEELRARPLKDADEALAPLWVEVLLTYAFSEVPRLAEGREVVNRLRFVTKFAPVDLRFRRARFRKMVAREEQRSLFDDFDSSASILLWLHWERGADSEMSIGWEPLITALGNSRPLFSSEAMSDLLIDRKQWKDSALMQDDLGMLRMIPDEVWAIILLAEGLDRGPWEILSSPLGWELRTYVIMAILLVRAAYLWALSSIGFFPQKELELTGGKGKAYATLQDALEHRDPRHLWALEDEQVVEIARQALTDGVEALLRKKTDPVSKAAVWFFDSPGYKVMGELLAKGL